MKIRLSGQTIQQLSPPRHGNRVYYDQEARGPGVGITAAGAVSFVLTCRIHGRERRYTIGSPPEWNATAARAEAVRLRKEIRDGNDPLAQRLDDRTTPTVAELCAEYLERHARPYKRAKSVEDDQQMIEGIIGPKLGRHRVDAVRHRDIQELHQQLAGTPYRANRVRALLSKMFALAVRWGKEESRWSGVMENPASAVARYPEATRERWLHTDELLRLRAALDAHDNQRDADAVRLIALTGSRKGEVLGATWDQFDLERGVWTKPRHHTKQKTIHQRAFTDIVISFPPN